MSLVISGATIIDGVAQKPIEGKSIWIEDTRIKAIGVREALGAPPAVKVVDARGKYVIPGLMNANVHLLMDMRLEILARYWGRYEELIVEAAQVALKNGLTTVFDTYGPRRSLMAVRDRIRAGAIPGSRIFCAGNIVGFDGPFSDDFSFFKASASADFVHRVNATWVENVGRHLMWLSPAEVAKEVGVYIAKGIDFVKYASNEHYGTSAGAFLEFSLEAQTAIVDEAHRAGVTAQAHTMSVEGLRIAVEAGCDLIQHANLTGPIPIPEATLELMARRGTAAVIFPLTKRAMEWLARNVTDLGRTVWHASDTNARSLIRSGVPLLLANDGAIFGAETLDDPAFAKSWVGVPQEESLISLGQGHFSWLRAMEEKGCPPMEMLKAATSNIAKAFAMDKEIGTLEAGKIADVLVLDKNPLQSADNYRSIHMIVKDGAVVDRDALPVEPLLTRPVDAPVEEAASYKPFLISGARLPICPMCSFR